MDLECVKEKNGGSDDGHLTLIGKMISSTGVRSRNSKQCYLLGKLFGPYSFINVSEGRDEIDYVGHDSRRNMVEVAIVMNIVQRLHKEWQCNSQKLSVCVVSPYVAQVKEIGRRLGKSYETLHNFDVKVTSVERFEESDEADIVIISTVRSKSFGSVGFVLDQQKTNFAMTKARHCLWILGNGKTLVEASSVWEDIVSDAKERKCYFNAEEDDEIAQVIIDVKSKLDELEDLLDKQSTMFKSARWKVVFSESFFMSFSKLPSTYAKKLVVKFLLKLANGWRPKKKRSYVSCDSSISIAKQFKVEDWYIICTNDISRVRGYYTQIWKVWDIMHLIDVPALVNRLDKMYGAFSDDFLKYCKQKCLQGNLEVPRCYTFDVARYKDNNNGHNFVEKAKVKDNLLLMKFYSLSSGVVSQLLSARDGTALNVPFEVSDEERKMVLEQRSSFILGRSGTGKTTVLVMKLFQKEQQHYMSSEGFNAHDALINGSLSNTSGGSEMSLRQLFVTINPNLCFAVKQQITNLRRFIHGENLDEGCISIDVNVMDEYETFVDVPESFEEIPSNACPLVITFNMFLLMLDRTVGLSYFSRFPDIRKIQCMESASSGLFCQAMKRKEVTYDKFRTSYWPHFNSKFTSKLDPLRVFTEINSCIKGQLHSGEGDGTKLSLQSYVQLSKNRVSSFSEDERKFIYKIFEDYEKKKVVQGEFDLSDLVNDLHHRLKSEKYEGQFIDFVYIDEVQDLTMKQLALFKYICKNVEEGFVFAGDTAQTIARGVDFRFQDIKHLFYKEFLHGKEAVGKEMKNKGIISPILHLSQNFRTHDGILNLAHSVVEIIYHFFPKTIDFLNPETSFVCGELPTLLDCGICRDAIIKIFQCKESHGENSFRFGSKQVIMVRDDYVREKLANNIGRHALVLTIFECKGLEFEDVLLYNFFGSSPLKNQWRLIYEYTEKKLCLSNSESYPTFTDAKHNILCYELKQLYVAITRTRQRLWICEDSDGFSSPMLDYWRGLNLIQVKKLDDSYAQAMQAESSLEDWRWQGIKFVEVHNYRSAIQCFERSGDSYWITFARASSLKAAADNLRGLRLQESLKMLREAAELFKSIKNIKKSAECYFDAEDYGRAGDLYVQLNGELKRAGQCYSLAGFHSRAAEIYAESGLFKKCLHACNEGKLFELGLHYIQSWQQLYVEGSIDLVTEEQIFLRKCAHASFKDKDKSKMMKFVKQFYSRNSMRTFLKNLGCYYDLIELELEWGNVMEAVMIAKKLGNFLLEADLLQKAQKYQDASRLYIWYAFARSWESGGESWPKKDDVLFCSQDSMKTLKSLGCFDEEAMELSRKTGNFLLEADLLEKMLKYQDATRDYIRYIIARSGWASAGKHGPKKDSPITELLLKAEVSAWKSSPEFHKEICTEIMLLSSQSTGLPELKKQLLVSEKVENLKWVIISTKKILDILLQTDISRYEWESDLNIDLKIHANVMIAESRISVDTLMYFWKSWKGKIWTTLEHINSTNSKHNMYWDFCEHYFGVRKIPDSGYFLVYPDAEWVTKFTKRSNQTIKTQQLVTAIHSYWCSELLSVGLHMLEILDSLQDCFYQSLPMIRKSRILEHVFECAQFLFSPQLRQPGHGSITLEKYIDDAKQRYVDAVFCMEWYKLILQDQATNRSAIIIRKLSVKLDH